MLCCCAPTHPHTHTHTPMKHNTTLGGVGGGRALNDVWAWHVKSNLWSQPPIGGASPKPRMDHALCLYRDSRCVWCVIQCVVWCVIRCGLSAWSESPQTPPHPPRTHNTTHTNTSHRGTRIFIFGGHDGQKPVNDLDVLVAFSWGSVATELIEDSLEERMRSGAPGPRIGHTATRVCWLLCLRCVG